MHLQLTAILMTALVSADFKHFSFILSSDFASLLSFLSFNTHFFLYL